MTHRILNTQFVHFIFRNDSFVDATPQIQKQLQAELDRVAKVINVLLPI